jgi:HlyD family secretion protein
LPNNGHSASTLEEFQSETAAIRAASLPVAPGLAIRLIAGMLLCSVAVTFIIPVDRVISSMSGKIVATEPTSVFQALDPSIIKTLDVKEGQQVEKGQLLATLDQTFAAADVDQTKQQLASLDAQIERADAELNNRKPVFPPSTDPDRVRYASIQASLFNQRAAQFNAQVQSNDAKIDQLRATIVKLKNDEGRYAEREKIAKQIEDMRSTLVQKQAGSVLNLLSATDSRLELLRTLESDHNGLAEAQQQLAGTQADNEVFKQQWFATTSQELVTARNSRDQAIAQLSKAQKHQDLVRLVAPETSVVLTVAKLSVGSVLKEGDQLMTLMPLRIEMEAETTISARDIGFLRVGDPATVKVDAFNYFEHGTAEGHVKWISEGAFTTDDDGKSTDAYYKARIKIDALHFTGVPQNFRLIPGMTLATDIKVGKRSLALYVLGAAMHGIGESMREP